MQELLTVEELANKLKIHKHNPYRLCHNRSIPFLKVRGLGIRFDTCEIEKWLKTSDISIQDWGKKIDEWI